MGDRTEIAWADATWNPLRARHRISEKLGWICVRVSQGCKNCYASTMNGWRGHGADYSVPGLAEVEPFLDETMLTQPLRWRAPRRIFVCSMTDLFGDWVPDEWIDRVFAVMAIRPQHVFQVLTKRPERMRAYLAQAVLTHHVCGGSGCNYCGDGNGRASWRENQYPNVWLGVSVEDPDTFRERWPFLRDTPAALHWISYEPALAGVDFTPALGGTIEPFIDSDGYQYTHEHQRGGLNWLVCGGESGPGARPFNLAWARSTIAQCRAAGVAAFFKQAGSRPILDGAALKLKDRKGGDLSELPTEFRVREYPYAS